MLKILKLVMALHCWQQHRLNKSIKKWKVKWFLDHTAACAHEGKCTGGN